VKDPTVGVPSRRVRVPFVVLSAIAVVLSALVVGGVLAQRRSAVAEPQATPALISSSPAATAPASSAAASVPSDPSPTQPSLNGLEVKVIDALGRLGITGKRAQLPFRDASIWADFGSGFELFVSAYPLGTVDRNYIVLDERRLAGITVQHVQRPSATISTRFECSGDEYWVRGAVPPGFTEMDAFVERFISALACSP